MSRNIPALTLNYVATAAIPARCIAKHGDADGTAAPASAGSDALLGVTTDIDAAAGGRVDVIREGIAPVRYGAAVTRGDALTADSAGRAVPATTGQQYIGFAEVSGAEGDIGSIHIQRGALA